MSDEGTRCHQCGAPIAGDALFCSRCGLDVSGVHSVDETQLDETTVGAPTAPVRSSMRQLLRDATLGEYEILSELGRGGMATVFLAHDISLDRKVAIKVMAPHLLEGEGMADRFKLEARTAAQLSHPHIIPIYAVKETESTLFFVMKYVEGKPLDQIIKKTGQLPIPTVKDILTKVGSALGYAHRRGVVHRDVKPGNVMIDEEGTPIVTDFGIAKVAKSKGLTMTGTTIGTPSYMSPEQCEAKEVTGTSDQYSLGIVAWEMLTGGTPFGGDSAVTTMYKHVHEPLPPLQDFRPDCPSEVSETVTRMLAKAPSDRWPSLEAAIRKLGTTTESQLDPIRSQLLELAKDTDPRELIAQLTPRAPMPGVPGETGGAGAVPSGPAGVGRAGRRAVVAAAFVVLAVGAGMTVWQPWRTSSPAAASGVTGAVTGGPGGDGDVPAVGAASPGRGAGPEASGGSTVAATDGSSGQGAPPASGGSPVGGGTGAPLGDGGAAGTAGAAPSGGGLDAASAPPPAAVASVRIEGARGGLEPGDRLILSARALDGAGGPAAGSAPRWSSSDASVGRIGTDGSFTAVGPGSVTITATIDGVSARETLSIGTASAVSLDVEPPQLSLAPGEGASLEARAVDRNGAPARGLDVSWRSDAPNVASVSSTGEVRAVAPGSATISASAGAFTSLVRVTVTAPAVDTRTAIEELVAAYARALESGDLGAVRRAYPGMTAQQEQQLGQSLAFIERADLRVASLEEDGDVATAAVTGTYEFVTDGRSSAVPANFRATFERDGSGWRMTATQ